VPNYRISTTSPRRKHGTQLLDQTVTTDPIEEAGLQKRALIAASGKLGNGESLVKAGKLRALMPRAL
jgi:hypothetical protein